MPLSLEQKNKLLIDAGYNPSTHELDDTTGDVYERDVSQPSSSNFAGPITKPQTPGQTFASQATAALLPTVAGGAGFARGAALGAGLAGRLAAAKAGAVAGAGAGPWGVAAGGLLGGVLGGAGASYLASKAQELVMPDKTKQFLAEGAQENPKTALVAGVTPFLLGAGGVSPNANAFTAVKNVGEKIVGGLSGKGARVLTKAEQQNLINTGVNAGLMPAISAAHRAASGEDILPTPGELAYELATGAVYSRPNAFGKTKLMGFHEAPREQTPLEGIRENQSAIQAALDQQAAEEAASRKIISKEVFPVKSALEAAKEQAALEKRARKEEEILGKSALGEVPPVRPVTNESAPVVLRPGQKPEIHIPTAEEILIANVSLPKTPKLAEAKIPEPILITQELEVLRGEQERLLRFQKEKELAIERARLEKLKIDDENLSRIQEDTEGAWIRARQAQAAAHLKEAQEASAKLKVVPTEEVDYPIIPEVFQEKIVEAPKGPVQTLGDVTKGKSALAPTTNLGAGELLKAPEIHRSTIVPPAGWTDPAARGRVNRHKKYSSTAEIPKSEEVDARLRNLQKTPAEYQAFKNWIKQHFPSLKFEEPREVIDPVTGESKAGVSLGEGNIKISRKLGSYDTWPHEAYHELVRRTEGSNDPYLKSLIKGAHEKLGGEEITAQKHVGPEFVAKTFDPADNSIANQAREFLSYVKERFGVASERDFRKLLARELHGTRAEPEGYKPTSAVGASPKYAEQGQLVFRNDEELAEFNKIVEQIKNDPEASPEIKDILLKKLKAHRAYEPRVTRVAGNQQSLQTLVNQPERVKGRFSEEAEIPRDERPFLTTLEKELSSNAAKPLGLTPSKRNTVESLQLLNKLKGGNQSEWELLKQAGIEDYIKGKEHIELDGLREWVRKNGPKTGVHTYGMEGKVSEAKKEYDSMTHEWLDSKNNDDRSAIIDYLNGEYEGAIRHLKPEDRAKAKQYYDLHQIVEAEPRDTSPRATSAYTTVSAFDASQPMPEWTATKSSKNVQRVDVVIPLEYQGRKIGSEYVPENVKGHYWQKDNLHENLPNTLGWAMIQYKTGGKKVTAYRGTPEAGTTYKKDGRAFWTETPETAREYGNNVEKKELQLNNPLETANWMTAKQELKLPADTDMSGVLSAAEQAGYDSIIWKHHGKAEYVKLNNEVEPKKIAVIVEAQSRWGQEQRNLLEERKRLKWTNEEIAAKSHPLLRDYNRLILKAAIDQARKEGATHIVVSDAETAMMAEGHDIQRISGDPELELTINGQTYLGREGSSSHKDIELPQLKGKKLQGITLDGKARIFPGSVDRPIMFSGKGSGPYADFYTFEPEVLGVELIHKPHVVDTSNWRPEQEGGMRHNYDPAYRIVGKDGTELTTKTFPSSEDADIYATSRHGLNLKPASTYPKDWKGPKDEADYKLVQGDLHSIAKDLTGSEGERVSLGEHKNAFKETKANQNMYLQADEIQAGIKPRSNLIFKNPDGTPKTDVSGMMYPLEAVAKRLESGEKMTLTGRKYSDKAEISRNQTDTPEFKKWFGESKVVDGEGKPLVVYHGSSKRDITKFKPNEFGAIYFTDRKGYAVAFSGDTEKGIYSTYLSLKNPATPEEFGLDSASHLFRTPGLIKVAKKQGYDGIIGITPEGVKEYIAFYPEQIKSATGNTGRFDPKNPDIRYSSDPEIQRTFEALGPDKNLPGFKVKAAELAHRLTGEIPGLSGATETLRLTAGKEGALAADAINEVLVQSREKFGEYSTDILSMMSKMKDDELRMWQATLLKGDRNHIDTKGQLTTPAQKELAAEWNRVRKLTFDEAKKANQPVYEFDKDTGEVTPRVRVENENYFPQVPSSDAINVLQNHPNSSAAVKYRKAFVDYQAKWADVGEAEANKMLDGIIGAFATTGDIAHEKYNALSKAEGYGLPDEMLEKNPIAGMKRYLNRFAKARAFYDVVETSPDLLKVFGRSFDAWGHPVSPVDTAIKSLSGNERFNRIVEIMQGRTFKASPRIDALSSLANNLILGPVTAASDMVTSFGNMSKFVPSVGNLPGLYSHMLTGIKRGVEHGKETGIIKGSLRDMTEMLQPHERVADAILGFSDGVARLSGRSGLETLSRGLSQAGAEYLIPLHLKLAENGNANSIKLLKGLANNRDYAQLSVEKLASRLVEIGGQGTYDVRGLPIWMIDSQLAPFFKLAKWNVEQTHNFYKHVVLPAAKGENYTPLFATLIGGTIGGYMAKELREFLNNKRTNVPSFAEILAAPDDSQRLPAVAYNYAAAAAYAGYAGLIGDLAKSALDVGHKNRPQGFNYPLTELAGDAVAHVSAAISAIESGEDILKVMPELSKNLFAKNIQVGRLAYNWLGDDVKREDKEARRDLRVFKQLSGEELPSQIIPRPDYEDLDTKRFKQTPDLGEAIEMLPELMSKAIEKSNGSPERLKQELRKMKANSYQTMPNPESMPLSFAQYVTYLQKTKGADQASEALVNYFQRNAINKVKSSLVPSL